MTLLDLDDSLIHQIMNNNTAKEVQIGFGYNGRLSVSQCPKHLKYFDNVIRNVTISSWNFAKHKNWQLDSLTNFILKKCDPNLHKICIVGHIELVPLAERIENFLRNVQVVAFYNREGIDDEAKFLKYCPNLRKLILSGEVHKKSINAILQQHYQQLTHFYYLDGNTKNLNVTNLETFFQRNIAIQCIVWKFCLFDDHARRSSVQCLRTINAAAHLQQMSLSIGNHLTKYHREDFKVIRSQLNQLCKRSTFKFLELELVGEGGNEEQDAAKGKLYQRVKCLASFKQMTKLTLHCFELSHMMPSLRLLVHLKTIVLSSCVFRHQNAECSSTLQCQDDDSGDSYWCDLDDLSTELALPQVEEAQIDEKVFPNRFSRTSLMLFRHWKNLKTVLVPADNSSSIKLDINELNQARGKLKDASEITIITNLMSAKTKMRYKLVKLKFVNLDYFLSMEENDR